MLSACFSYAHLKLYQHKFERSLLDEGTRALRTSPELNQVSLSFSGLHAHLSGFVPHPRFRQEAQDRIDAIPGAQAPTRFNQVHVAPVVRVETQPSGTYRVTGWLPSEQWRDRLGLVLSSAAPRRAFDTREMQYDPSVLEPAYLDQTALPALLGTFFASVSQGSLMLEPNRLKLTGSVRTETEKLTLQSLAVRTMSGPGNPVVENEVTFVPPADPRARTPVWVGSTIPGMDVARALRSFPIFFDSGSTVLKPEEAAKVEQLVAAIKQLAPRGVFVVTGYADASGNPAANQRLCLKRAETVAAVLVARGIPRAQLELKSLIEKANAADSKNPEARRRSRRVEVSLKENPARTP